MVVKANQAYGELGGHIASYASGADLFETGFNHFFMLAKAPILASTVATWFFTTSQRARGLRPSLS